MQTPLTRHTIQGGRLESRAPVVSTSVGGATKVLPGNGDRYAVVVCAIFDIGAAVASSYALGLQTLSGILPLVVLSPSRSSAILKYEDVGDAILLELWGQDVSAGGVNVTVTEIVWHPNEV